MSDPATDILLAGGLGVVIEAVYLIRRAVRESGIHAVSSPTTALEPGLAEVLFATGEASRQRRPTAERWIRVRRRRGDQEEEFEAREVLYWADPIASSRSHRP